MRGVIVLGGAPGTGCHRGVSPGASWCGTSPKINGPDQQNWTMD